MSKNQELEKVKGDNLPSVAKEHTLEDMMSLADAIKKGTAQETVNLAINLSYQNWQVSEKPEIQRALLTSINEMKLPNKRTGEIETHVAAFFVDLNTRQTYYKISVRFVQAMRSLMEMQSIGKFKQFSVKFTGIKQTKSGGNMEMFEIFPLIPIIVEDNAE